MKVRTYGRKTKTTAPIGKAFLDNLSPSTSAAEGRKVPLAESSHNVQLGTATPRLSQKELSLRIPKHSTSTSRQNPAVDTLTTTFSPPRSGSPVTPANITQNRVDSHACRTFPIVSSPNVTREDDLSALVADLSLECIREPQHQRTPRPPIEVRKLQQKPAKVCATTRKYLSPLLECKNVSSLVEDFQSWMDEREDLLTIVKIGEGSFGEVYRAQGGDEAVILKLMPLSAQKGKGSRSYTSVQAARNEVRLLARMSKVPGFVEFRGACILQGAMARQLIQQWSEYLLRGRTVESKDPRKKDSYLPNQLWLLIEMSDAGESLERGRYAPPGGPMVQDSKSHDPYLPVNYSWDIFWQIVKALAKGEVFAMYEHRDLHMGNICVKNHILDFMHRTVTEGDGPEADPGTFTEDGQFIYGIATSGIEVTLIDYSLSRASLGPQETLSYDFKNDKALLKGKGDLQYDMYRHMAAIVGTRSSSDFVPQTNVMWLYYVLQLLLDATLESKTDLELGMLQILKDLKQQIHPSNRSHWAWDSAGDLLHMGVEASWFLPAHVMDI